MLKVGAAADKAAAVQEGTQSAALRKRATGTVKSGREQPEAG